MIEKDYKAISNIIMIIREEIKKNQEGDILNAELGTTLILANDLANYFEREYKEDRYSFAGAKLSDKFNKEQFLKDCDFEIRKNETGN